MNNFRTEEIIRDLMGSKQSFTPEEVRGMLLEIEACGFMRAELFFFEGKCYICKSTGNLEVRHWQTGEPTGDSMICWACCGDGKWPHKCHREKYQKYYE